MLKCLRSVSVVMVIMLSLAACGGGGGSSGGGGNSGVRVVAVDPYVVGATLCEDANNSGTCDPGEQVSSITNASGEAYFASALTMGSDIIIETQGMHVGVPYTGDIKRTVDQADDLVISPLTTLLANGWTAQNVIDVLQNSGSITGLTAADLNKDPLAGVEGLDASTLTADHFKIVKSTIAIHSFLSIMQGVLTGPTATGGGYNITYAVFSDPTASFNGQTPQWYVDRMVDNIGGGLDPAIVSGISTSLALASTVCTSFGLPAAPPATAGEVIRGSVAIADYVIPQVIADLAYAPTLADYGPWRSQLGLRFYLIRTKDHPCISAGISYGALTPMLGEPFNTAWTSCKISSGPTRTGEVVCF